MPHSPFKATLIGAGFVVLGIVLGFVVFTDRQDPSPSPTPVAEYRNTQYGLAVALPDSWKGFTTLNTAYNISAISAGAKEGTGVLINIRHPQWTTEAPRQDLPIMVFTYNNWNRLATQEISVGAAPIAPTELARNSQYVFALPARYNYAFLAGWEEVQAIIDARSVAAFEPFADTSNWKTYTNTQYGFSFKYPATWTASQETESWDNRAVALIRITSPEHTQSLKSCGIPCEVSPYNVSFIVSKESNYTLDQYLVQESDFLRDKAETTLDDIPAIEATLNGLATYHVVFAEKDGRIYEVFFDTAWNKSDLTTEEKQILSTFKFTR